jgi:hypothetical protein
MHPFTKTTKSRTRKKDLRCEWKNTTGPLYSIVIKFRPVRQVVLKFGWFCDWTDLDKIKN